MFSVNNKVRTVMSTKNYYRVVGVEYPLPIVGGTTNVLMVPIGKKPEIIRIDPKYLVKSESKEIQC
jgi:hypothetical protein